MTPEATVKKQVMKELEKMGAYFFYPVTGGYGKSGVPDIVGCYMGKFFGIEVKSGNNKPTMLQVKNLREIREAGGIALVINEQNVGSTATYIEQAWSMTEAMAADYQSKYGKNAKKDNQGLEPEKLVYNDEDTKL